MKLHQLPILLLGFLAISLSSCEDEFNPNAEYKETAIVYALLDSNQPVQYVKVNKAFLNTNTNALVIAANHPDSSQFYDPIEVKIEKIKRLLQDTVVINSYTLTPVTITNKEPGDFYYPEQTVYASQPNEIAMSGNDMFRVVVTNLTSGRVYSATTHIVSPFCVDRVGYNLGENLQCGLTNTPQPIIPYLPLTLQITLSENASIYKAAYQINYMEIAGSDTAHKSTDVTIIPNLVYDVTQKTEKLDAFAIYNHLNTVIDTENDPSNMIRKFEPTKSVIIKVTAGGEELQRYIQVNNTYSAITQARPFYSNVTHGAGLVSSRFAIQIPGYIAGDSAIIKLNQLYPDLKFTN